MAECKSCFIEKIQSEFYLKNKTGRYDSVCKKCRISGKNSFKSTTHKTCKHCGEEKPFNEYQKAGGGKWLQPYCKPCDAERKRKYGVENKDKVLSTRKRYYKDNKDAVIKRNNEYRDKNIEKVKERSKKYRERNGDEIRAKQRDYGKKNRQELTKRFREKRQANKEFYQEKGRQTRAKRTPEQNEAKKKYDREYKIKNKDKYTQWRKDNIESVRASKRAEQARKMSDPNYRIKKNLRSRIRIALKGVIKSETTQVILGCEIDFFREYIESQFKEGMTWENYGRKGWHIDHKIPVSWFNLSNPNCLKLAFNYKNHQPLFWEDNLAKGNKYHHKIETT